MQTNRLHLVRVTMLKVVVTGSRRMPEADEVDSSALDEISDAAFGPPVTALDDEARIDPDSIEDVGLEGPVPVDERELEEAGATLDDPEAMGTLDDGADDPDGLGEPSRRAASRRADHQGWDLDESLGRDE